MALGIINGGMQPLAPRPHQDQSDTDPLGASGVNAQATGNGPAAATVDPPALGTPDPNATSIPLPKPQKPTAPSTVPPPTTTPDPASTPAPNGGSFTGADTSQFNSHSGDAQTGQAWTPTSGIVDQIQGITPQNVNATGYTSNGIAASPEATATGYDPTSYTAQQGTAQTSNESVSDAVARIISADGPLQQRARALADQQSNSRGLLNSSMAVGASQAATLDSALPIAQGDVQNSQFNAHEANVMTISNVQQANAALAFHADAQNQAAAFSANAKNMASQFNSAQAQQRAIAASQLWDQAAQFSAAAENAARSQNASAYNQAMQRYVDAKNAALAAQNDAENLSRRDTATFAEQTRLGNINAEATVAAANAHAAGTVAAAQISAQASTANTQASIEAQREIARNNLNATQFDQFNSGLNALQTADLPEDSRQNAIHNYMAVWQGSGYLPFNVNLDNFPPAGPPPAG